LIDKEEFDKKLQTSIESQFDQSNLIEKAFKEPWNDFAPLERNLGVKNPQYAESLPVYENLQL
jgi:hypothetical protein